MVTVCALNQDLLLEVLAKIRRQFLGDICVGDQNKQCTSIFALSSLLGLRLSDDDVPNSYVIGLLRELIYIKATRELYVK